MTKRAWGTAATVLLAPVACIAALVGGMILLNLSLQGVQQVSATADFNSMDLQPLIITMITSADRAGHAAGPGHER